MNLIASLKHNFKEFSIPIPSLSITALYNFQLNGNLTNTGTDTSQTMTTNGTSFTTVGTKTSLNVPVNSTANTTNQFNLPNTANSKASVSVWVYPNNYALSGGWNNFIYYLPQSSTDTRIGIQRDTSAGGVFYFLFGNANTTFTVSGNELALNQWTLITITWSLDGTSSTAGSNAKLYINSTLKSTLNPSNWGSLTLGTVSSWHKRWNLGVEQQFADNTSVFSCNFYKLVYWNNKELTSTEITSLVNAF